MSKLTFIQNYNNYFNRIIKVDTTFTGYTTKTFTSMNFNPNDDVTTEHIINWNESWMPDYVLVLDDNDVLVSRWFITEAVRTRQLQYKFSLKRDLIADYYNNVINAPMIVKKGMVPYTNNLIFNKEGFRTNQVLTSQQYLRDSKNEIPWIYLYCAKNAGDISASVETSFTTKPDIELQVDIANSIYANGTHTAHASNVYFSSKLRFLVDYQGEIYRKYEFDNTSSTMYTPTTYYDQYVNLGNTHYTESDIKTNLDTNLKPYYNNYKNTFIASEPNTYLSEQEANDLRRANGKIVRDINGNYYDLTVTYVTNNIEETIQNSDGIAQSILGQIQVSYPNATVTSTPFEVTYRQTVFTVVASPRTDLDYTVSISQSTHHTTDDCEYNIVAIPLGDVYINYTGGGVPDFMVTRDSQLEMAMALTRAATTSKIYDMQLLPYSPFSDYCNEMGMNITSMNDDLYQIQTYNGNNKNILFYVQWANFTLDIAKSISVPSYTADANINYKVCNECDTWRLCSPNFNGVFEFNVAQNRGVTEFNVNVSLRPYNPYIHVNPVFKALYGDNYNDPRGLICGGDFSLPIVNDAFTQYELNNKNYQIAFDRQITNMEFTQGQEKTASIVQAITGTITGAAGGAMAGRLAGGAGAGVGAAVGAATSAIGGAVDLAILDARQQEQKSFAIDNYNYQLGNIRALPYSVNKVNPLTENNKIWPVLEYYTCTNEEKDALVNKITYTGMTIDVIGTISNFKTNYSGTHFYQGDIIRLENLGLAAHEAYEIYKEIKEGVYI